MSPDEARAYLRDLGKNYPQVREKLAQLEIKGKRNDATRCPVARYLEKCGAQSVAADIDEIWVMDPDFGEYEVKTPDPVAAFIRKFDRDYFPELEES